MEAITAGQLDKKTKTFCSSNKLLGKHLLIIPGHDKFSSEQNCFLATGTNLFVAK
jgi:hypothetical protein